MIDETTGGLVFELKKAGELGPGAAFTARLEVDYKKPMPASADVICTARVESVEGRKVGEAGVVGLGRSWAGGRVGGLG